MGSLLFAMYNPEYHAKEGGPVTVSSQFGSLPAHSG